MGTERDVFCGYVIVVYGLVFEAGSRHVEGQSIIGDSVILM
jgi:hypothetical protein